MSSNPFNQSRYSFPPPTEAPPVERRRRLTFGTYRVSRENAARTVTWALEAGIRSVDTAQLYKNESAVLDAVRSFENAHPELGNIHVCTKLFDHSLFDQTLRTVGKSAERLGRALDVVLLHRPLPVAMWRALDAAVERGLVTEIGVSNYPIEHLKRLLRFCDSTHAPCRRPAVNQVELHPFVGPVQPLLSFSGAERIRVQGHTVFARGQFFEFAPLARLASELGVSPATVMLRWAQELGVEVVFNTSNSHHLRELVTATESGHPLLGERELLEINGYYGLETRRFYPAPPSPSHDADFSDIADTTEYVTAVAARLDEDRRALASGLPVSNTALNLPAGTNRELLTDANANRIALRLFPVEPGKTPQSSYDRFRELVRKLRARAHLERRGLPKAKKLSCALPASHPGRLALRPPRFVDGEPVSEAIAYPEAMPVEVAPEQELQPFFEFLRNPERLRAHTQRGDGPLVWKRGAYFSDQRMDLCKQVVGPDHIADLCAAVQQSFAPGQAKAWGRVRHFLLGNNIACEGHTGAGAHALARLMADRNAEIETWYLAGNSIGPFDMGVIARSLENNVHARALWLKRNPLGAAGAAHLGRLLAKNQGLCLLDVHNTGLFDEGVEALVRAFEQVGGVFSLRHLYASANAISERGVNALFPLLTARLPTSSSLVSLSLSLNRLGNRGCAAVAALLETGALARLERLDLGSIGLERPDLSELVRALIEHCPELKSFDLGTHLSTRDIGEKANLLDANVTPLVRLLREHPALELLDVSRCGLLQSALDRLAAELGPRQSLHGAGRHAFRHTERERRFLKHPERVVHIDSIYRGRA